MTNFDELEKIAGEYVKLKEQKNGPRKNRIRSEAEQAKSQYY